MSLPFLKERKVPTLRKMSGVSLYGFSEDDELIDHALDELIEHIHNKDHEGVMESLMALVHAIKNKEPDDASSALEDAKGV